MPNICTGFMNVRGYSPNVDEFVKILQANYSYYKDRSNLDFEWCANPKNFSHIPHFFRVFDAYVFGDCYHSGIYKAVSISIECAWSVHTCMFPGPHTYYDNYQKEHFGKYFASNILAESKRLQLEIEIWSYEPGMSFQEHYKICSGILVKEEEFTFSGYSLDDYANYEEYKEDFKNDINLISEQEFNRRIKDDDCWIEKDLHEEEVDFLIEDEPIYLAHIVMAKPVGKDN